MFGPARYAVAKAVADSVAEGVIPADEADDVYVCVGVFIHWEADDKRSRTITTRPPRKPSPRAVAGEPKLPKSPPRRICCACPFAAG